MEDQPSLVDINTARPEEIAALPGVGPDLVERILAARPFASLDDLRQVKGIGGRTLERLRLLVEISAQPAQPTANQPAGEDSPAAPAEADLPAGQELPPTSAEAAPDLAEAALEQAASSAEVPQVTPAEPEVKTEALAVALPELAVAGEAEASAGQVGPAPTEAERPPAAPAPAPSQPIAARQPVPTYVTRTQALWMAAASGGTAFVLAVLVMIFLLVAVNGGLRFVRPTAFNRLSGQVEALNSQAATLQDNMVAAGARIDTLEKMSAQVAALQAETGQIQKDMKASGALVENLSTQVDSLSQDVDQAVKQAQDLGAQVEQLSLQVDALKTRTNRFQTFLDGLRDLVGKLFKP